MVDDAVAERRGGDHAVLRVEVDGRVAARTVAPGREFALRAQDLGLGAGEERRRPRLRALARRGAQGGEGGDGAEQVTRLRGHGAPFSRRRCAARCRRGFAPRARSAGIEIAQVVGEAEEEAQLLHAQVGAAEMRAALAGVGRPDERFEHVEGGALDAIAEASLSFLVSPRQLACSARPSVHRDERPGSESAHRRGRRLKNRPGASPLDPGGKEITIHGISSR